MNAEVRRYIVGGTALAVVAGVGLFFLLRTLPGSAATGASVELKCTSCGEGYRTNVAWMSAHSTKLLVDPGFPGAPCPKCGKEALAEAVECPKDHTFFFTKYRPKGGGSEDAARQTVCPTCGFDPVAARQEELDRLLPRK